MKFMLQFNILSHTVKKHTYVHKWIYNAQHSQANLESRGAELSVNWMMVILYIKNHQ